MHILKSLSNFLTLVNKRDLITGVTVGVVLLLIPVVWSWIIEITFKESIVSILKGLQFILLVNVPLYFFLLLILVGLVAFTAYTSTSRSRMDKKEKTRIFKERVGDLSYRTLHNILVSTPLKAPDGKGVFKVDSNLLVAFIAGYTTLEYGLHKFVKEEPYRFLASSVAPLLIKYDLVVEKNMKYYPTSEGKKFILLFQQLRTVLGLDAELKPINLKRMK